MQARVTFRLLSPPDGCEEELLVLRWTGNDIHKIVSEASVYVASNFSSSEFDSVEWVEE